MQVAQTIPVRNQKDQSIHLAIAASFTAEPLEEALSFWMMELGVSATIEFAPYNQIFQQLLAPSSLLATNRQGINIICLRVEDWCRFNSINSAYSDVEATLKRNAQDLVTALQASIHQTTTPFILCLCPASSTLHDQPDMMALLQETEAWIVNNLQNVSGLHILSFEAVQALYPVADYYDAQRDRLGHIPFTPEFFTALGTAIARRIYAIKSSPHKVIVLDCDNTLWKGVVGEDGVHGIDLSSPWQAVQQFMVAQQQAGMLLCLCSKNNEADVMQVFEQRHDMVLKRDHLVAWRINWSPKSENIQSLAAELNLGLDSFIFIDDNPVECAEVGANCPDVLTLQLPIDDDVYQFLNHVWAFDHLNVTDEDAQRTALYQQNLERQRFQQQVLSLDDFLRGLEMTIEITEPTTTQLSRIAQLTQRTNQFNFTTIRRTDAEIQQLMRSGMKCRAVTVRDRFGDYGLVGVMLFSHDATTLNLDTLLLSCRVLGRGVEHQMIRHLAAYAREQGLSQLSLTYIPTQKNQPAIAFLEAIAGEPQPLSHGGSAFRMSVDQAEAIAFTSEIVAVASPSEGMAQTRAKKRVRLESQISKSQLLGRIATELFTPQDVLVAIQNQRQPTQSLADRSFVAPRTPIECDLSVLWNELLGIYPIGLKDNYFELGGTSLQAVELFAKIEQYFGKKLPLTCLLEAPTLEELAQVISADSSRSSDPGKDNTLVLLNRKNGITPPLFLIHPAGGDVLLYRNLAQRLQSTTSVYAIKPCSRNGYPIVHTQISAMAAYYIEQIRAIQPDGPYFLGGFCGGGAIAFEMALQLQQQGCMVPLVALMNSLEAKEKRRWERSHQGYNLFKTMRRNLRTAIRSWVYKACLATLKNAPQFIQKKSVFSVCAMAADSYRPERQFKGELVLFKSKEKVCDHQRNLSYVPDPYFGWQDWATQGVKMYESEGNFQGILQEPFVKEMAEQLQSLIGDFSSPNQPQCHVPHQFNEPPNAVKEREHNSPYSKATASI